MRGMLGGPNTASSGKSRNEIASWRLAEIRVAQNEKSQLLRKIIGGQNSNNLFNQDYAAPTNPYLQETLVIIFPRPCILYFHIDNPAFDVQNAVPAGCLVVDDVPPSDKQVKLRCGT